MNQYLNYFTNYPNKILNFIISNNIIDATTARYYEDVFTKFSMMAIIENKVIFEKDYF